MSSDRKEIQLNSFQVGGKSSKRSKLSKSFEDEKGSSPIDEIAQDEIISELRRDAERLNRNGRAIFCCVLLLAFAMYTICLTYSFTYPFEMEHQVLDLYVWTSLRNAATSIRDVDVLSINLKTLWLSIWIWRRWSAIDLMSVSSSLVTSIIVLLSHYFWQSVDLIPDLLFSFYIAVFSSFCASVGVPFILRG